MARVFINYTPEQLLSLSVIMAVLIAREYDARDQVILVDLLGLIASNISLITDQKAYLIDAQQSFANEEVQEEET